MTQRRSGPRPFGLLGLLCLPFLLGPSAWALDGEVTLTVERTLVQVVMGPPGTAPQEVGVDRARSEALASHSQSLGAGWSFEGTLLVAVDSLPSSDARSLPPRKLDPSAKALEGWLAWEALPGAFTLGAGKRILQPSSAFHHKPLDWVGRSDDPDNREGRTGAQAATFGDIWSVSVFLAPAISWDGTNQPFALGRVGLSLGSVDLKALYLQSSDTPRVGLGLDWGWGDHLTVRAESAADTKAPNPGVDTLGGLTWTNDDRTSLMVEASWDSRAPIVVSSAFARWSGDLDERLSGEAWLKAEQKAGAALSDLGGWLGSSLTWTAPRWALKGSWLAAWGPEATTAGDSPLRWRVGVEIRTFW